MTIQHPDRFDPAKRYLRVLWPRDERHLHAHDLNDEQRLLDYRIKAATDVWLRDGSVVEGNLLTVNRETGAVIAPASRVYGGGIIHSVPERRFTIPTDRTVRIGICVHSGVVTYLEDPALKGQIAGTRTYGEPGADRLEVTAEWIYEGERACDGIFYAVYTVITGEVLTPTPPIDPLDDRLARYDREANGHYIVAGWRVQALGLMAGAQHFSISEGVINVWGYKRDLRTSLRIVVLETPVLYHVESEPHLVPLGASGSVVILSNHGPIALVRSVTVLRQRTVELTHGPYTGAEDPLPDTSVAAILSVTQGGTTFAQGSDYVLTADHVDWRQVGTAEPAPGSTYSVTYQFLDSGPPDASNATSVTVSDVVAGSMVILDYDWALPRIDAIAVDRDGRVHYVEGQSSLYTPIPPRVPLDLLAIAHVTNRWGQTPTVRNVGTRAMHNTRLELHDSLLQDLYDLVAQERLRRDMDSAQPTAKRGLFVDPLLDDDMRDQGLAQTGAIVAATLRLPILTHDETRRIAPRPVTLAWSEELLIDQPLATSAMKVNPYMAFAPLPARVHIDPAIDTWTALETSWTSAETRTITQAAGVGGGATGVESAIEVIRNDTAEAGTIRPTDVAFDIEGFGVGEPLAGVTFDGIAVTPRINPALGTPLIGDAQGRLSGLFTIPAGIPVGAKRVVFTGVGGTIGRAAYVGSGRITTQILRLVTTVTITPAIWPPVEFDPGPGAGGGGDGGGGDGDPLAQTFTPPRACHIAAVDIRFAGVGDPGNPCICQIREVALGLPTPNVVAEAVIPMGAIVTGVWTHVAFETPAPLLRNAEYAIVILSDDPDHALATAGLGDFDTALQRFVAAQPYQIGVLLSSSNARTWTPHNGHDLTFRVHAAHFTETERVLPLPQAVELVDCTDLMVNVGVDEPGVASEAMIRVTRPSGEVIWAAPGQTMSFAEARTESVAIAVVARGTVDESPLVYPWMQIIQGTLQATGTYISRAMPAGNPTEPMNVVVTFDCLVPGAASLTVEAGRMGEWTAMSLHAVTPIGDGWQERSYTLSDYELTDARIRITLTGTAAARPLVREIRANVTGDPINIITGQ